jgi:spore germination protein
MSLIMIKFCSPKRYENSFKMHIIIKTFFITIISFGFYTSCFAVDNIFYILRNSGFPSLKNHYKSVNVLISQAYRIDESGVVAGVVNPEIVAFAKQHSIKLMVLITNVSFDQDKAHHFLENTDAQKKAIESILDLCNKNHYYGVQFDFENISVKDREFLTRFYQNAANALHKKKFAVSFAVVPVTKDGPQESAFLKQKYDNWGGAYDLKNLGKIGDFISVMAYDQHTQGNIPGPTASIRWVDAAIHHALRFVPRQKLSLGIPIYSGYWFTHASKRSGKITTRLTDISYKEVEALAKKYHTKLRWDNSAKINFAMYQRSWLYEYIFAEDARSFKAKLALAKKYKLHSISVFNLGNEDPRIWNVLKKRERS